MPQQASSIAAEWQKEKQEILVTVEVLEKHKDWADKKIGQLIKRVTEAERPQKDEAYRLRDEVGQAVHEPMCRHLNVMHACSSVPTSKPVKPRARCCMIAPSL